jgi:hypothetical protein
MPEFSSPLHIWRIVSVEVIASSFEAIVESLALNIPELLRRRIPAAAILVRWGPILSYEQHWRSQ